MMISFLIPCYGSENTIEFVIKEIIVSGEHFPDLFNQVHTKVYNISVLISIVIIHILIMSENMI